MNHSSLAPSAPRVAIVGARRVRQGLGPFVARYLRERGAEVVAYLGTSDASLAAAAEDLARIAGVTARGYTDIDALIEREQLDVLIVLSPTGTHERYLDVALAAGLHVLCEKPLLWGRPHLAGRAAERVTACAKGGRLLRENCQWPHALPAFHELFPAAAGAPLERFGMRLSPTSRGIAMIADALSHPLSVLQALTGAPGELSDPVFSTRDPQADELEIEFRFGTPEHEVRAHIGLVHGDRLPRDAGLSINEWSARREVDMSDYSMYLASESGRVRVPDPLDARIGEFLEELAEVRAGAPASIDPNIVPRMQMLERLLVAYAEEAR